MSDVIVQTVRATEVVSVPKYSILNLGQDEVECLLALMHCQLSDPENSPLAGLKHQLDIMVLYWENMRGSTDMRGALADKYAQFVKG